MVFNTGAALLDAIVLAVVSRELQGTYGYKITQEVREAIDVSESHFIRYSADCRRTNAWKCTTWNTEEETGGTIRSQREEERS